MLAASVAWDRLAAELAVAASSFGSVTSGLAGQSWQGARSRASVTPAPASRASIIRVTLPRALGT
nr:PPE domain-containing protein [Mycobacterium tuberculosis]